MSFMGVIELNEQTGVDEVRASGIDVHTTDAVGVVVWRVVLVLMEGMCCRRQHSFDRSVGGEVFSRDPPRAD